MTSEMGLQEIERKVFTSFFRDGLWDIYGGLILLGIGLYIMTDQLYTLILCVVSALILLTFRKHIIIPRMGRVVFSVARETRTRRQKQVAMIVLTLLMFLGIILFILLSMDVMPEGIHQWLADYFLVVFGGLLGTAVGIAAYMTQVLRFYIYAVLVFVAFLLIQVVDVSFELPVTIAGGIIVLSGVGLFVRFLQKYPRETGEETNDIF